MLIFVSYFWMCWWRSSVIQVVVSLSALSYASGPVPVYWRRFTSHPRGFFREKQHWGLQKTKKHRSILAVQLSSPTGAQAGGHQNPKPSQLRPCSQRKQGWKRNRSTSGEHLEPAATQTGPLSTCTGERLQCCFAVKAPEMLWGLRNLQWFSISVRLSRWWQNFHFWVSLSAESVSLHVGCHPADGKLLSSWFVS